MSASIFEKSAWAAMIGVSFPAAITVTIPDDWQNSTERIVLVDGTSPATPASCAAANSCSR